MNNVQISEVGRVDPGPPVGGRRGGVRMTRESWYRVVAPLAWVIGRLADQGWYGRALRTGVGLAVVLVLTVIKARCQATPPWAEGLCLPVEDSRTLVVCEAGALGLACTCDRLPFPARFSDRYGAWLYLHRDDGCGDEADWLRFWEAPEGCQHLWVRDL
jgi:hypothetical protein